MFEQRDIWCNTTIYSHPSDHTDQRGVTLAQLVKASVGQADVQRFEPHLGHNLLSCGVFLVKSRHFELPLAQTIRPNWQSLLAGGSVAIQMWKYSQNLYLKRRGHLLFQVWAGYNTTLPLLYRSCAYNCPMNCNDNIHLNLDLCINYLETRGRYLCCPFNKTQFT